MFPSGCFFAFVFELIDAEEGATGRRHALLLETGKSPRVGCIHEQILEAGLVVLWVLCIASLAIGVSFEGAMKSAFSFSLFPFPLFDYHPVLVQHLVHWVWCLLHLLEFVRTC